MNLVHAGGVHCLQECVRWCSTLPSEAIYFRSSCQDVTPSGHLDKVITHQTQTFISMICARKMVHFLEKRLLRNNSQCLVCPPAWSEVLSQERISSAEGHQEMAHIY